MSPEAKRGNQYEDKPTKHTVAAMRAMFADLAPKLPDIKSRSVEKQTNIRDNFDQLKRLLDAPDETVLSESEYNLAKGLLKNIQQTRELPISSELRNAIDIKPISVVLTPGTRSRSESSPAAAGVAQTIKEAADMTDEVIDFSDNTQIERYDHELLNCTKNAFSNQHFFKEHNLIKGLQALGTMRVVFVHWDRALQQLKAHPEDAHIATLLNKHHDKIIDLVEVVNAEVIANQGLREVETDNDTDLVDTIVVTEESVPPVVFEESTQAIAGDKSSLDRLILDASLRVESSQPQRLTMVSLPEAEKMELDEVHRMERSIQSIEEETLQLGQLSSWRSVHEVGNTEAMIDQFKRMLANYYEQPTPGLFERLKKTFDIIETLHQEAKEGRVDVPVLVADVDMFERDLSRLEQLPSTNPLKENGLRVTIEKFRAFHARYIRAEAGEEKNILLQELVRVYKGVKQAHLNAEASVIQLPAEVETVTEFAALKNVVDELSANTNLPTSSRQSLSFVKTEMITRLGLLSPTDPQYILLREKIKEVINAAQQLSGEVMTVAPAPTIEGVANQYLAPYWPETKEKLTHNRALAAALVLATAAVLSPDKLSEYDGGAPVSSLDMGSTLNNIGATAVWGSGEVPVAVVEGTDEVIRIPVRPYTRDVVAKESATMPQATVSEVVIPETMAVPAVDLGEVALSEDLLPHVSVVEVPHYTQAPATLGVITGMDAAPPIDTSVPAALVEVVPKEDQKSSAPEERLGIPEVITSDNVIEVLRGNQSTYPDRAIDTVFATVDGKGLPEVLLTKLKAREKTNFLSDRERLMRAGLESGEKNTTFPGEKINYTQPKAVLERTIAEHVQYLNVPHTEVALEGDNLTKLTLQSFARDLVVLPEADRLGVVETALNAYLKTPDARKTLKLEDTETVPSGAVVPLQAVATFLATAVAEKVRSSKESGSVAEAVVDESQVTEMVDTETATDTIEESGSASEVSVDEVTSVESYPGGMLAYSQAYNEKLESLGIASKAPSMIDSWFSQRIPNNRALLEMTVGELTKIMMQTPREITRELDARKISYESANELYKLIIAARAADQIEYDINSPRTGEEVIRDRVLAEASKSSN